MGAALTGRARLARSAARLFGPWVHEVDRGALRADATAGLLGAVLALPQGIAFATLAGLPPAWGLYTAVVPCIVAALAGSSRHVVTGPTNAVSLALLAMLAPLAAVGSADYLRLALAVTLAVGLAQTALALARLGSLANFISPSVMLGFTTGAAVLIGWHALRGLVAGDAAAASTRADAQALALAAATLTGAALLRRLWPRGPWLLVALVAASAAGWALLRWGGWSLQRVGELPAAWPGAQAASLTLQDVGRLAGVALALTIVSLGQTVAIAKALAARSGQPLDVNRECLGQGLGNVAGSFFSCFVAAGSLNRSLPNLDAGARTPLAAVFSGLLVLVLAGLAAPALAWIPTAAVAGVLLWVALSLPDRAHWRHLWRVDRSEFAIAAATGAAALALPLQEAVLGGVGLSLLHYLHRTSRPALRSLGFDRRDAPAGAGAHRPMVVLDDGHRQALPECPQLKLLRMEGSVYFGAVAHVGETLRALRTRPAPQRHLLVMAKSMNFLDDAGAALWEQEHAARRAMGGDLYFHRPRPPVLAAWQRRGFLAQLGLQHVFDDKRSALATIVPRLDPAICAGCTVRLFDECKGQPGPPGPPPARAADASAAPAGAAAAGPDGPARRRRWLFWRR